MANDNPLDYGIKQVKEQLERAEGIRKQVRQDLHDIKLPATKDVRDVLEGFAQGKDPYSFYDEADKYSKKEKIQKENELKFQRLKLSFNKRLEDVNDVNALRDFDRAIQSQFNSGGFWKHEDLMHYLNDELFTVQTDIAKRQQSKSYKDIVVHATYKSIPELLAKGNIEAAIRVAEEANIKANYFEENSRDAIIGSYTDEVKKAGDTLEKMINQYQLSGKIDLNTYTRLTKVPDAMDKQHQSDESVLMQINAQNAAAPHLTAINLSNSLLGRIDELMKNDEESMNKTMSYTLLDKSSPDYLQKEPEAKQEMLIAMAENERFKGLTKENLIDELDKLYTFINTPASNTIEAESKRALAETLATIVNRADLDPNSEMTYLGSLYGPNFAENIRLDAINNVLLGYAGNDDTSSQMEVLQRNYFNSSYKKSINPQYTGSFEDYMNDKTISKPNNKDFEVYIKTKAQKDTEEFLGESKIEIKNDEEERNNIPEGLTKSQTGTITRLNQKIDSNKKKITSVSSKEFPSYERGVSTGMTNAEVINEHENDMIRLDELEVSLSDARQSLPSGIFQIDDPYIDELQAEIADIKRKYMFGQSQIYNVQQLDWIRKLIRERDDILSQNKKSEEIIAKIKAKAVKP